MLVSQKCPSGMVEQQCATGGLAILLRARHFRQTYKNIVNFNQIVPDRV